MAKGRYEIKDTHYPDARGMRFAHLAAARRELMFATPPERFVLIDHEAKEENE